MVAIENEVKLVLSNPLDTLSVIKKLDMLKHDQIVYIEDSQSFLLPAKVVYEEGFYLHPILYTLENDCRICYIDEPDEDEKIPGVFVSFMFRKADFVSKVDWNKEGF